MDNYNVIDEDIEFDTSEVNETKEITKKDMRKYYASIMWRLVLSFVVVNVVQAVVVGLYAIVIAILSIVLQSDLDFMAGYSYIAYITIVLSDALGVVFFALISIKVDKAKIHEYKKMNFGMFLMMLFSTYGVLGIGMLVGNIVTLIINLPFGILVGIKQALSTISILIPQYGLASSNPIGDIMTMNDSIGYSLLGALVLGILVPILEELMFRKFLIDHLCKYGVSAAILLSGLVFGLYHGNFSQFFYAFGLGIVFGAIYAHTGKLIYTILLHMAVNLYSSGLMSVTYSLINKEVTSKISDLFQLFTQGLIPMEAYTDQVMSLIMAHPFTMIISFVYLAIIGLYYLLMFVGFIVLVVYIVKLIVNRKNLVKGVKGSVGSALFNYGAILAYVFCALLFLINFVGTVYQYLTILIV